MSNYLDQDMQELQPHSGKLVLPAPSEATPITDPHMAASWPDQPTYAPAPSDQPTAYAQQQIPGPPPSMMRKRDFWRKDPAYLVLSLAIALVVISALVLVAFGATTFLNNNGLAYSQTPTVPTPSGTVDAHPNLGTPATGSGSNQSSQPPFRPTPNLNNQPSPNPGNQPAPGALSVQIVTIPNVVANNSRVSVGVLANEPNVQVKLQVTYNVAPFFFNSGPHTTDGNGQATLVWTVRVFSLRNNVQATVHVVATDQNGQQVSSQTVIVTVK